MASMIDFRRLDEGLRGAIGKKRAREEQKAAQGAAQDAPAAKRVAVPMEEDENKPAYAYAAPTYDGVIAGRVSGRRWKEPKKARASSMLSKGGKPLTVAERMKERQVRQAYKERKNELKEQIRTSKQAQRAAAVERKRMKAENEVRGSSKLQKITNPKTLKKMSKKAKKLLRRVPEK